MTHLKKHPIDYLFDHDNSDCFRVGVRRLTAESLDSILMYSQLSSRARDFGKLTHIILDEDERGVFGNNALSKKCVYYEHLNEYYLHLSLEYHITLCDYYKIAIFVHEQKTVYVGYEPVE